jgi:hypothetical protein
MRRLAALTLAVALTATAAWAQPSAPSVNVQLTQEQAWTEALKFLALKGLTAETLDRANGRIVATGDKVWALYASCPKVRGIQPFYQLNVMLAPDGAERVTAIVSVDAGAVLVRRKRFLFIRGHRVTRDYDCQSTGVLEQELFAQLKGAAPP